MACSESGICFSKGDFAKIDWDDSALIEAYDRAMGAYKEKLPGYKESHRHNKKEKKKSKWQIGDYCQTIFADDNLMYEAEILEIHEEDDLCVVRFIGYDNEQLTEIEALRPSKGKATRAKQIQDAKKMKDLNWEVGDICHALYGEDGLFYPAEILEIYRDEGTCLVKYDGYDNEEEVALDELLPDESSLDKPSKNDSHSHTKKAYNSSIDETSSTVSSDFSTESIKEESRSRHSNSRSSSHSNRSSERRQGSRRHGHRSNHPRYPYDFPTIPATLESHEELGPVLMAWYMAGFHTGYYQGRTARLAGRHPIHSVPDLRPLR